MTLEECERRINVCRDKYVSALKSKNTAKQFMGKLTLIIDIMQGDDRGLVQSATELLYGRITNPSSVKTVKADLTSAENTAKLVTDACNDLINDGTLSGGNSMNVFMIMDGASVSGEILEAVHNALDGIGGVYINILVYSVCVINELQTDAAGVEKDRQALWLVSKYIDRECVFALGRRKLSGEVVSHNRALREYSEMICNLIINAQSIPLPYGAYSLGMASLIQYAENFWMQILLQISRQIISGGNNGIASVTDEDVSLLCESINSMLREKYRNDIYSDIMDDILCNDVNIVSGSDIGTIISKLYGHSLEVYLENEQRAAVRAVTALKNRFDELMEVGESADYTAELMRRVIPAMAEQIRNIRTNNENSSVSMFDTVTERNIKEEIFRRYLHPNVVKITNDYYIDGLKAAENSANKVLEKQEKLRNSFIAIKDCIYSVASNYINTEGKLDIAISAPDIDTKKPFNDGYIDDICSQINNALVSGDSFVELFANNKSAVLSRLMDKAEPYCCNNNYNVSKRYYMIGSSFYADELASEGHDIKALKAEYLDDTVLLNCSSIDIDVFIGMI